MGVCMCGGESERGPPCGCAAYMWICGIVCVVAGSGLGTPLNRAKEPTKGRPRQRTGPGQVRGPPQR